MRRCEHGPRPRSMTLDGTRGDANVELASYELIRDGVIALLNRDVVIDVDPRFAPLGVLIRQVG